MYAMTDQRVEELKNSFTYHAPKADQIGRYQELRELALNMAMHIEQLVPPGRARSVAQTKLEELIMWCNKGIACGEV